MLTLTKNSVVQGQRKANRSASTLPTTQRVSSAAGAYAEVEGPPEAELLRVFSREGELIFEYDPQTNRTRLCIPRGDLEFTVPQGSVKFCSAREIRFRSESIEMTSRRGIRLAIVDVVGKALSAVTLQPRGLKLSGPALDVAAGRAEVHVQEAKCMGKRFLARFGFAQLVLGKLESLSDSIVEKAKNVYRTVEELTQLKTGRLRTVVESSSHFKANQAYFKTTEDFNVDGEKINLG